MTIEKTFLDRHELIELTGYSQKAKQIEVLRANGTPFTTTGRGKPVMSRATVRNKRESLEIQPFAQKELKWDSKMDGLLGTMPDVEVAKLTGLTYEQVLYKRRLKSIPKFIKRKSKEAKTIPIQPRIKPETEQYIRSMQNGKSLGQKLDAMAQFCAKNGFKVK